jgi:hypothetical protein
MKSKKTITVFLIALLLMTATVANSANSDETHLLSLSEESLLNGGFTYGGLLNGFAIGMASAAFFGCIGCAGIAIVLKAAAIYCR